ncbi:MAG TPA: N-acetylmuramoyl-L-alanine amidase [Parafilimonas sp.]|nr:N-acetylmuramoyl-L-alanine amidase [Parafilimonas sp.]
MLQQISIYLLKVIGISGLFFLYYHIALRNKQFHYYNRFYLLMATIISAVLPLMKLQWFTFFSSSEQTIHLYKIIYGPGEDEVVIHGNTGLNAENIILYSLVFMCFLLIVMQCFHVIKIHLVKKKYPVQQFPGFDFINTDIPAAPFSFLKNIFWRNDISLEEETGKQILQHKITHIRQKHSWDKLYIQFLLCFYWMNPFFHLVKKELYLIHEFIADEHAVKHSDADAFAKMLLTAQFGKFNFLPAQSIFYSSIKRRLIMLTTSKKPQFSYARRLMALPLITALICLFAFTIKTSNSSGTISPVTASKPFMLVVDAGHGGKDYGALGYGLYEKDAALKVAQKIKELSSQYGIDVILTRNSDVYMTPVEKSNFANTQNANAFISIHANADNSKPSSSGFEVLLSSDNEKFGTQNQVLGSSILQTLSKDFNAASALHERKVGIWILKNSNIPSALIECGFITNKGDADNLKDDAKIELMAKNILQGVAMYANNSFDKSQLYKLQNAPLQDTNAPVKPNSTGVKLLYLLDGKEISEEEMNKLDPNAIESVSVLKDKNATDKYGDKGGNGVVEIISKSNNTGSNQPLYILNEKIVQKSEVDKLDPNTIESINVLKDKNATDKYGDKGKYGVVEITLKDKKTSGVNGEENTVAVRDTNFNPVFTDAQVEPKFPGGTEAWKNYLLNKLDMSILTKKNAPPGIYTVTVSFLVGENGKVSDIKALNDPGYGTAAEAVRVIKQGPDWVPASQNGHNVAFENKQKIAFNISN